MHNYVPENQANLISMLIRYATRRVRCTVTLDHYDDTIFNITLIWRVDARCERGLNLTKRILVGIIVNVRVYTRPQIVINSRTAGQADWQQIQSAELAVAPGDNA